MPSEEARAFFAAVCQAVRQIPPGRVTSYGHIAALIGAPQRPRHVGACLKHLPADPAARFNARNVPWQRVVSATGRIPPRPAAPRQAAALRAEGVRVRSVALGALFVDLESCGWFPRALPDHE